MNTLGRLLALSTLLLVPALASAQPAPVGYPWGPSRYGAPVAAPMTVQLPSEMQRRALDLARRQAAANYDAVPTGALDAKRTENLQDFAAWVTSVRMQREYAAALVAALDDKEVAAQARPDEIARLKAALTAQVANRDGWLDKGIDAWAAQRKRDAEAKAAYDRMPQMSPAGPPRPPNAPVIYKSPAYMIAVDGLYGDDIGMPLTAGNIPLRPGMGGASPIPAELFGKTFGRANAFLDILQFGYSAGGWMGNEVIIHGQMQENYEKKKAYEERYKQYEREKAEWDAGGRGRPDWEAWQSRLREEARSRAARDLQIFTALFGRASTWQPPKPAIDPKLLEALRTPPPARPVAKADDFNARDAVLRLNRGMSTINCHQPQRNDTGFSLSLDGFNGSRRDNSRLLDILTAPGNAGGGPGAGTRR